MLAAAAVALLASFAPLGCARAPVASTGAEARARFLAAHAAAPAPTRGVGEMRARVGDRGGSFQARWGSAGESLVVVGYAGPVRALDASLLGDSLYVGIRPQDLGVAGIVRSEAGLGGEAVRFVLRPWSFGAPWMRDAIERAGVEPRDDGWRLRGDAAPGGNSMTFTLDLSAGGEPRALTLVRADETGDADPVRIRYGGLRGYAAGRFPRWVEWERGDAHVRLDLRDVDPLPGGTLRLLPPPPQEWRVVSLDDPEGRELLGRLLGASRKESP
jgi:hypothetical protein